MYKTTVIYYSSYFSFHSCIYSNRGLNTIIFLFHIIPDGFIIFRPILLNFGMFDQIRLDHGTEFFLCIFVQELLAHHRQRQDRASWRQTRSVNNTRIERMWPEENQRVNYPIKRVLIQMQRRGLFDFDNPIIKFCVSWVVMHVCHESSQNFVNSWNHHRIPGNFDQINFIRYHIPAKVTQWLSFMVIVTRELLFRQPDPPVWTFWLTQVYVCHANSVKIEHLFGTF